MGAVVIGMILVLVLGVAVMLLVAVPAHQEGRDLLTEHGEAVMARATSRTKATVERTEAALASATRRKSD